MVRFICYLVVVLAAFPLAAIEIYDSSAPDGFRRGYVTHTIKTTAWNSDGTASATRYYKRWASLPTTYSGPPMPSGMNIKSIVTKANLARLVRGASMAGLAIWAYQEFMDKYDYQFNDGNITTPDMEHPEFVSGRYWAGYNGNYQTNQGFYQEGVSQVYSDSCSKFVATTGWSSTAYCVYRGVYSTLQGYPVHRYQWYATYSGTPNYYMGQFFVTSKSCSSSFHSICNLSPPFTSVTIPDSELLDKFREFDQKKGGTQLPKLLTMPDGQTAIRTPDAIDVENELNDEWDRLTGENNTPVEFTNDWLQDSTGWEDSPFNPKNQQAPDQIITTNNPSGSTSTIIKGGDGGSVNFEPPIFCDWASFLCDWLDWFREPAEEPEHPALPVVPMDIDQPDYDSGLGGGVCPEPITVDVGITNLAIDWTPLCTLAGYLKFFVVAFSYIFAVLIVVGSRST